MTETEKTLERLMSSGKCDCINVKEYIIQLKQLAEQKADREGAKRRERFFKALGDEARQKMLALLSVRELCVCEVIVALTITQSTTSHHLKILENAGLIQGRKDGKWTFYRIRDK